MAKTAARAAPAALLTAAAFFKGVRLFCGFFSFSYNLLLSSLPLSILNISSQLCCGTWRFGGPARRGSFNEPL